MPAPGQGALAVEIRDEPDMRELIQPIMNRDAQAATSAERMFMRRLGAGCYLPVAAHGEITGGTLTLRGLVISLDGQRHVRVQQHIRWTAQSNIENAEQLGVSLAEEALEQGADQIIRELGARGSGDSSIKGKRILVTRSGEQASALSDRLRASGAIPIEFPMIRIEPPGDWQPLDDALRRLCEQGEPPVQPYYAWLVFTSANGVAHFFARLYALGYDALSIRGTRVAAIGSATRAALARQGVSVDLVPGEFVAERLAAALVADASLRGEKLAGKRILLARAAEARDILPVGLQQEGALVDDIAVYRTTSAPGDGETGRGALRLLQAGRIDMLTFTSSSTVRYFVQWLNDQTGNLDAPIALIRRNPHVKVACIGPVTAQTARELGLQVDIEAKESTIEGLIEAILR